jgi:hypothetical protein
MIPRKPLFLALAALFLAGPARAQDAAQLKDLCSYVKDVVYEQKDNPDLPAWKAACEPVDAAKLEALKTNANFSVYLAAVPARQKTVFDLYTRLTTDKHLKDVNDDSDKNKSDSVALAMKFNYDSTRNEYSGEIVPPVNERTFPAWLTPEQNKWVFPKYVIAQNAALRGEKYHPEGPAPDPQRVQAIDQQLEQNKVRLYQMRGISDVNQFAQFVGEGWQRADDGASGGVTGSAGGAAGQGRPDNRPANPQQRLKIGAAPKPYVPGDLEKNGDAIGVGGYSVNTKSAWGLVGAAAGLVGVGLAGYVAKAKKEISGEDTADVKEKADEYGKQQKAAADQAQAERDAKLSPSSRELIVQADTRGYTLEMDENLEGFSVSVLRDITANAEDPTDPAKVQLYVDTKNKFHGYGLDDEKMTVAYDVAGKIGKTIRFVKKK